MAPLDEILVMVVQEVECKERHQVNGGQVAPELDISVAYLRYGIYAFVEMWLVVVVVSCSAGTTLTIPNYQRPRL